MNLVGVVLCGGRSSRMGLAKPSLPFGDETLLTRTVRIVAGVTERVIVVAAPGQEMPRLASTIQVVRDESEGRGPLEGMRAGLSAAGRDCAAFITGCDTPFLLPALIERMASLVGEQEIAVPWIDGFYHPLAAVYRSTVVPEIEALLAADQLRPTFLFERVPTRRVTADELRDVDPQLASLRNLNTPADYLAALADANFTAPADLVRAFGNRK
ncbi:MAG TPA: molybdenum cofactor guanylyltransferase [Pirellulales bacterium]|nr:molybdenum cofactor guanylyltransferase [Pirellulales bacterium]